MGLETPRVSSPWYILWPTPPITQAVAPHARPFPPTKMAAAAKKSLPPKMAALPPYDNGTGERGDGDDRDRGARDTSRAHGILLYFLLYICIVCRKNSNFVPEPWCTWVCTQTEPR